MNETPPVAADAARATQPPAAPAKPTELYLALDRTAAYVGAAATVDLGPVRVWDLGR